MNTLEQHVLDALLDRNPRQSEQRVKKTIADALATFDPSARLVVTSHFNHTYLPDMVMSWGQAERPVFLRFTDNVPELGQDITTLDSLDPLVFGLSTPELSITEENELDQRSRDADAFLTTPAAIEELTALRTPAATDRMLRNSLAHAGRGALVGSSHARTLADTFSEGFTAAASGEAGGTREALSTIERYFVDGQARRLNRVVQAVWEGGGARLDQYPGEPELSTDVESLQLLYLIQLMDTDDTRFWRGVGRNLKFRHLVDLARADAAANNNFQHLINANLDVLRARACQVLDMRFYDTKEPPATKWGFDLPISDVPPALTLRGPGFHAYITRNSDELKPRLQKTGQGVAVEEYIERAQNASVASVNVSVGGKRIAISDDSGTTDSTFLKAATSGLPSALVDKAAVSTPTGRVTVDFSTNSGTGVTRSDTLLAHLLHATTMMLVPLESEARAVLTQFLDIDARPDTAAGDPGQLVLNAISEEENAGDDTWPTSAIVADPAETFDDESAT